MNRLPNIANFVLKLGIIPGFGLQQVRCMGAPGGLQGWADWRMIKDNKRRKCVAEHFTTRLRLNALRKNKILPRELQEIADAEIDALPPDSRRFHTTNRCSLTSRARGTVHRWRMSRIVWRHYADYNKLSGVIRAHWG